MPTTTPYAERTVGKRAAADKAKEEAARQERLEQFMESDPQGFQELLARLAGKMLIPHSEGQKEVLQAEERFLVLCAGRRWGKTKIGAAKMLRMLRRPNLKCAWVAPTYKVVKRGYDEVVDQLPDGLLTKPAPPSSVFDAGRAIRLTFKNGASVEFYSAERADAILGASFDFVILDEAATMKEMVWAQIIRPTLGDRQGKALFISTPRQQNWFYHAWLRGQSEESDDSDWRSWRFPSRSNTTIPQQEFDDMARDMPQVKYEQEILASFNSDAAAVFRWPKVYTDEGKLVADAPNPAVKPLSQPRGHVTMGVDLAKHNDFTVLLAVNANGFPCYHDRFNKISWPDQRQMIREAIAQIMRTADGVTVLVDSGGPGDVIFDDLEEEGYDVVPINFTTYKEKMVKLLSSAIENKQAFVVEEAVDEFNQYGYSVLPSGRIRYEALRDHDDEVSAALLAYWGLIHEGAPNVQTLSAGPDDTAGWEEEYVAEIDTDGQETIVYRPPSTADLLMDRPEVWGH